MQVENEMHDVVQIFGDFMNFMVTKSEKAS